MLQASQKQIKSGPIERVTSNQKCIRFKPVPAGVVNAIVNPSSQQKINLQTYAQSRYNKNLSMSDPDMKKQRISQFSCPQFNLQLDPIDEKIRIPFESNYYDHMFRHHFKSSFQPFKEELRDWLIDVIQITCSITLNHLKMHRLNQKEAKNFASKNILLNIKEFFERHSSIPLQHRFELMNFINTQSHRIFTKISYKYPQNGQAGVSKRLKSQIHKIDNRDSDYFDFLFCHNINITYRQDADYSQDIMKVINKLISITADVFDTNDTYQQSNYEVFTSIMEYIFQNASSQSVTATANTLEEMIKERKIAKGEDFLMEFKSAAFGDYFQNSYARDQLVRKSVSSIKQSSRKVFFGQKIPSGTRHFTEDEVNGEYFKIHHSSILRILTKWAEQLRSKIQNAEENILKRIYKVKDFNGNLMNMEIDLRTKLYEAALEEFHNVQEYLDYLKKQNMYMQTLFAQEINVGKYCKNDTKVGTFAAKINEISSQYMFKYINQLIHSLLSIPKKAAEKVKNDRDKFNLSCVNLVTLKIGDLMRCRCATTQKEFIKILNALEQTSMRNSKILKIIRIKNRLQQQSNDLLINLFFANKLECQLQLSVDNQYQNLEKSVSSFNHYVYQIIRAQLGPISELSIIIAQYDPLVNIFSKKEGFSPDLVEGIPNAETQKYKQARLQERMKFKAKINIGKKLQLPFVCWKCSRLSIVNNSAFLYRDPQSLKRQCNECLISRLKKGDNFQQLQLQYIIKHNFLKKNEQQFMKRHLVYQSYDKFTKRLINNRQNADNLQNVGMLMKRNQKRPNLILFNATYEKTTSKILLGSFNEGQKVKLIINVPVNVNQKKRQDILKKQFNNYFVFQCKNINKIINRGHIFLQCSDQRCCRSTISLGSHINQEQIKNLAHRKLIQEHFQNQKSTLYLNNTPKAFEIVESVLSESDPHKRVKVCRSIKGIEADNCSLQSIEVVIRFANIYELNVSNNVDITSLKGIEDCQRLKILDCKRCSLTSINQISGLKRLEHLNLSHNKSLEDINGLASLTELKKVYLNNTQISTLKPLQKCNKLQILDIQECKNIKSISDIASEHLNYLSLVNCGLQSFDLPLQSTSNLKVIEIYSEQSQNQEMMKKIKAGMKINLLKRKDSSVQMKIDDIIFNLAKLIIIRKRSSEDDD